jgi:hypothetical protein
MVTWKEFSGSQPDLAHIGHSLRSNIRLGWPFSLPSARMAPHVSILCVPFYRAIVSMSSSLQPLRSGTTYCETAGTPFKASPSQRQEVTSSTSRARLR